MARYKIKRMLNPCLNYNNEIVYVVFKRGWFGWKLLRGLTLRKAKRKGFCGPFYQKFKNSFRDTLKGAEELIENEIMGNAFRLKMKLRRKRLRKNISKTWDIPPFGNEE